MGRSSFKDPRHQIKLVLLWGNHLKSKVHHWNEACLGDDCRPVGIKPCDIPLGVFSAVSHSVHTYISEVPVAASSPLFQSEPMHHTDTILIDRMTFQWMHTFCNPRCFAPDPASF